MVDCNRDGSLHSLTFIDYLVNWVAAGEASPFDGNPKLDYCIAGSFHPADHWIDPDYHFMTVTSHGLSWHCEGNFASGTTVLPWEVIEQIEVDLKIKGG